MKEQSPFQPILPKKPGDIILWGNLHGASISLALTTAAANSNQLLVVATPDVNSMVSLETELKFFTNSSTNLPILTFPDWETLPYDIFSPHQDIISQRILTLYQLPKLQRGILLVPIATLMQRIAPREHISANSLVISKHDTFNIDQTRRQLEQSGYRHVSQVMEHGEFAVRGSIIDLFPMGSNYPYRIDLFDNEIDSIRTFDPETQRSLQSLENVNLLPAREFPLTQDAIETFRQQWRETFPGNPLNSPIYQDITEGICPSGIEYYLPLFFKKTESLFDYLPENNLLCHLGDSVTAAEHQWTEINQRYEQRRYDSSRPLLSPKKVYLSVDELFAHFKSLAQIKITANTTSDKINQVNYATQPTPSFTIDSRSEQPLHQLESFIQQHSQFRVLITAESAGRRETLLDLCKRSQLIPDVINSWDDFLQGKNPLSITIGQLERGFFIANPNLILLAEAQLFGQQIMQRRRRAVKTSDNEAVVKNLAELTLGAPVVHLEHGIGRYIGLQTITVGDHTAEYVTIEYTGSDKLYVPVSSLHLISRYSGADVDNVPINRLGTEQWSKTKRKAVEALKDVAAELLDLYAKRSARKGFSFAFPEQDYAAFIAAFPFETTVDQQQAIDQVIADMTSDKIMDRLICGDVGFGKTEVAMRAAFVAVQSGKQVAMLVPTTLLAMQHFQNFKDRFADWPVKVEVISRFRTSKEQQSILDQLSEGKVDIVIGTHKLLQDTIQFKNLGLLMIDEEHRFGVKQKEQLKKWRNEVDMLTLTATPIPRTLNMALSGIRELSIIATPPLRRLAIKTFVHNYESQLIREAILRELSRGGQAYFLHNEVESIQRVAEELSNLIPEARIDIAHGQMRERELEHVMANFYHQRFHILVCTTIVESGIDVPTANTMIINRADKLGLAQLHQIRGRVGRSHHQAYAYLLTPPGKISSDAEKRLEAIASLEDLGAGFTLATHDLEIRGAGELLGEEQSGNIHAIGFSLYMELLEKTVDALRHGKEPDLELSLHTDIEIDLQIPVLIPENYLPDIDSRLTLYKRIANAVSFDHLDELQVEMIDRFGLLPPQAKNLFAVTEVKLIAKKLGIRKIEANANGGRIEFNAKPSIDPLKLIQLIQTQSQLYKLHGQQRLQFNFSAAINEPMKRIEAVKELLDKLR